MISSFFKDKLIKLWEYILGSLNQKASEKTIFTFGCFSLLHYPVIYLIGSPEGEKHIVEIILRVTIILSCLPLCVIHYWPEKLKQVEQIFWFFCITYSLPFFATFMFIDYNGMQPWPTKLAVALLWLVLITSWGQFLLSVMIGSVAAIFLQYTFFDYNFSESPITYSDILNSFWIVVIAGVFSLRKEIFQQEKQRSLQAQAAAIAHEMRSPLGSIAIIASTLKEDLPPLLTFYRQNIAQEKNKLDEDQLENIEEAPSDINTISRGAFALIDMMLMNLKEDFSEIPTAVCSIKNCLGIALKEYPFNDGDRDLIKELPEKDFEFKGNDLFMKYLFFNLLKNSIYYVRAARKGDIRITSTIEKGVNKLSFKDTGTGISSKDLPHIFDKFYSKTKYGTGVGLAFCKMVMENLGGTITCTSKEGEYTKFVLSFPKLGKN